MVGLIIVGDHSGAEPDYRKLLADNSKQTISITRH